MSVREAVARGARARPRCSSRAAWMLNPLCFALSPIALAWVLFYSYTKRFTRFAHLALGVGLSIAPVGGYLARHRRVEHAVVGARARSRAAVMSWGGGFDILYALQDIEFDREHGLYSLPVALRRRRRRSRSRACCTSARSRCSRSRRHRRSAPGAFYWAGVVRRRAAAPLRALARAPGRSLAARRRVLHDERRDQRHLLRLRARGAGARRDDRARAADRRRDHGSVGCAVRGAPARGARARASERVWLIDLVARTGDCCRWSRASARSRRCASASAPRVGRVRHALRRRGSRCRARVGLGAHARHGDLSVLDGHARGDCGGHVALAHRACGAT